MINHLNKLTPLLLLILSLPAAAEVPPAASLPCFPGAYYRKAVSSVDLWTGIEGVITLPTPQFDPARKRPKTPAQYLDNPSIYIGGRAGETEIDAGVTWEVVQLPDGTTSPDRRAYRPFWRNKGWHAAMAHPDYYFYPGDTIRLRIESTAANKLTLTIELINRGSAAIHALKPYGPATRPAEPLVVPFDAPNFSPGSPQQFKRVNAIDQVGREGKEVDPTGTTVTGAAWHKVTLLRGDQQLPMLPERFTDMRCPAAEHFHITPEDNGGEHIDISGLAQQH
ncbi:MAG TPA: G1 family glutamic endopeptidase [Tepidisphaeraceae bacterium]|jgi:hypothetical protein|nr:G1 family glutamic endopeptidase [Tepidisphaeraceae bacterium]